MKTAVPVLLALLLLVAPAVSQAADDTIIVPGVRIGKWTLKMTIDDLVRMNGPYRSTTFSFADMRHEYIYFVWEKFDFGVDTIDRRTVELLVMGDVGIAPYKTDKGIGLQSTRADVLKAYGKPTMETVPRPGLSMTNMIYDAIGINFLVYDTGGPLRGLRIFRPGTAKSIWKF